MRLLLDQIWKPLILLMMLAVVGCVDRTEDTTATTVPPTPTSALLPTVNAVSQVDDRDFIVVATDAPNPNFTSFDKFGNVIGFDFG